MTQPSKALQSIRQYLSVIAQPVRLDILLMLQEGELCVCDIYKKLGIAQNLASHHLKVLVDLKLLTSRKVGLKVLYTRNEATLSQYQTVLTSTICKQKVLVSAKQVPHYIQYIKKSAVK